MASSFLYNTLVKVLNKECDDSFIEQVKDLIKDEDKFVDSSGNRFGIILNEENVKTLIEKNRDKFEYSNVCIHPNGDKSENYDDHVVITHDDPEELIKLYNEIKEINPDVKLGVLENGYSCY